jgi:hypothetical protein
MPVAVWTFEDVRGAERLRPLIEAEPDAYRGAET